LARQEKRDYTFLIVVGSIVLAFIVYVLLTGKLM